MVNLTRVVIAASSDTLAHLRQLKTAFAQNVGGRPAFVIICADPFLATRCRELLADVGRENDKEPKLAPESLCTALKTRTADFSDKDDEDPGTDAPNVSIQVKNAVVANVRNAWLPKARDLQIAGFADVAESIRRGIAFLQTIAALPVGYTYLIQNVEGAEDEHRLNAYRANRFKEIEVASMLFSHSENRGSSPLGSAIPAVNR